MGQCHITYCVKVYTVLAVLHNIAIPYGGKFLRTINLLLSWFILLAKKLNPSNLIVVHNAMTVSVVDP